MPSQDPQDHPALKLQRQLDRLDKHIPHFQTTGDEDRLASAKAEQKHTADRLGCAKLAAVFVDQLGLKHEVTPDAITYNDAVAFVAKVLHERLQGVTSSQYTRSHQGIASANEGGHVEASKLFQPRNLEAEIAEHLELSNPSHLTALKSWIASLPPVPPKS